MSATWQNLENYKLYDFQQLVRDKFKDTRSVLIGDDMGLGKTLEAIDLDWQRRLASDNMRVLGKPAGKTGPQPTLILTKMSVVPEWEEHYNWMFRSLDDGTKPLRVVTLQPKDRPAFVHAVERHLGDIYIMHWDALRLVAGSAPDRSNVMQRTQWFHIIADEAHRIKSRKAVVTRALKRLKTQYKTAATGTPADNAPQDLWSILNWLYPNNFRSYWNFYKAYVDYDVDQQHGYYKTLGVRNTKHLHKQMASFYIRRRKEEVLKDLPDKYYNTVWVDLSPAQRKAYNDMKRKMLSWVGVNEDKPMAAPNAISKLVRLQQFAVASVDVTGPHTVRQRSKKYSAERVAQYLWSEHQVGIRPEDVELHLKLHPELAKALPHDERYQKWFTKQVYKYVLIDPSTKLDAAMELVEDSDEPLVFFSHFKTLINLFGQRLQKAGVSHGLLTGDTTQDDRGRLLKRFQGGDVKVFAGTIMAGGEGITLTKSSHVAFFDREWSPSKNRQAEDRLHRIGQKNAVQVTDIMARDTIDLGRVQQIQRKWTWLQMILGDKTFDYQKKAHETLPMEEAA